MSQNNRKGPQHVNPNSGRVEGDADETAAKATHAATPTPDAPVTPEEKARMYAAGKSADELKAEYLDLQRQVQQADAEGRKLERKLLDGIRDQVKAKAGDLDTLRQRKREVYSAYEYAARAEGVVVEAAS